VVGVVELFGRLLIFAVLLIDCYMMFWLLGPEFVQGVRDRAMGHRFKDFRDITDGEVSYQCRCGTIRYREFPEKFWRKHWRYYKYQSAAPTWVRCGTAGVLNQLVGAGQNG